MGIDYTIAFSFITQRVSMPKTVYAVCMAGGDPISTWANKIFYINNSSLNVQVKILYSR